MRKSLKRWGLCAIQAVEHCPLHLGKGRAPSSSASGCSNLKISGLKHSADCMCRQNAPGKSKWMTDLIYFEPESINSIKNRGVCGSWEEGWVTGAERGLSKWEDWTSVACTQMKCFLKGHCFARCQLQSKVCQGMSSTTTAYPRKWNFTWSTFQRGRGKET